MPKISVIVCIYNALPLVEECLTALLTTAPADCEIILVDNHSPDESARIFISSLCKFGFDPRVKVVDPGKNLGCHGGWNFGFERSTGDFVCKLDDDTVILTPNWADEMVRALTDVPELAFASSDIDAKQANQYENHLIKDVPLQIAKSGIIGFSFVMFRRADIERWNGLQTKGYVHAGNVIKTTGDRLYGGEEVYIAIKAREERMFLAHLLSVRCHHLGNEERHPDYPGWKMFYGYYGWTDKGMAEWLADGDGIRDYTRAILLQLGSQTPNDVWLCDWCKRLGDIGKPLQLNVLNDVFLISKNDVVKETAAKAIDLIRGRGV